MDSNAVVLDLLHYNIINRGDQRTITRTEDPTEQNKFLHLYLKEKCTEDAFHLVCDIISNVKGNPKMSALGTAMKRSLQKGNCVRVCTKQRLATGNYMCACVCVCDCEWSHEPLVYHMHMSVMTAVLCVVRSCSTPYHTWCLLW